MIVVLIVVVTNGCVRLYVVYVKEIIYDRQLKERGRSNENISKLILFQHITANKVLFAVAAADVIVFKTAIRHRRLVLSLGLRNGLWQYSCDTHSESIKHSTAQHTYSRGAANWEQ